MRLRQRRQGYRMHQARLRGEKRGVSPVVATLILILIAVAAAAALYLWLVVWQGNLTKGIGQPGAQATLTIGGSTSVYPFSSLGVSWFEQNNTDVAISDNQGGTSAGLLALCSGAIDIGASSQPLTASTLETSYGCPSTYGSTITITPIAYDAVDLVVPTSSTHGLLSMNWDTLALIYTQASSSTPTLPIPATIDGQALTASITPLPAQGTEIDWNEIPAAVQGAAFTGIGVAADSPEALTGVAAAAGTPCTGAGFTNDVCATAGPGTGTPCGWTVCASGAQPIVPFERSDGAGATLTLEAKLFGAVSKSAYATSFAALGYSGCGSNNVLSDCGITLPSSQQEVGDTGVLSSVAANPNAIGYASDGLARSTSGIGEVPFAAIGQVSAAGVPQTTAGFWQTSGSNFAYNGIVPTTGSTGSIAGGITVSGTVNNYAGWRPFVFVSLEPYTGLAQEFVTFLTDPAVNAALALATHEVGLYSV